MTMMRSVVVSIRSPVVRESVPLRIASRLMERGHRMRTDVLPPGGLPKSSKLAGPRNLERGPYGAVPGGLRDGGQRPQCKTIAIRQWFLKLLRRRRCDAWQASVFLEIILSAQPCSDLIHPATGFNRGPEPSRRDRCLSHYLVRPDRHRHARGIQLCADHVLKLARRLPLFAHRVPIETIGRVKRGIGAAARHTAWRL
jgi:hypothetical protein